MKLVKFIEENHYSIIDSWVKFAMTMQPWAKDLSMEVLRDHAEQLLVALVEDMKSSQSLAEQFEKSKGIGIYGKLGQVGKDHASGRMGTGISLVQLASEFRALRSSILSKWEEDQGIESGEVTRFNEGIDETLINSIAQYSETVANTREQFLAILSHDLRSPVSAIAMGGMLLKNIQHSDTQRISTIIVNSSMRMNRMIDDLLDLARTRLGGGIPVTPKAMDLASLCQQIVQELKASYPDHHLDCQLVGDLHGEWDSDRLAQVISNLATNALRYGSTVKPVRIVAREQGQDIVLEFHNHGLPIPEDAKKRIFEPMTRIQPEDRSEDRNKGGLGLGLFITREIITSHGGEISVASTEKEGTTFTIMLPRHQTASNAQAIH